MERKSEGIVVARSEAQATFTNAVQNNAAGAKDPWGGHVDEAGKGEGMAGKTGPNDPDGRRPSDKVRELQRRLWAAAKGRHLRPGEIRIWTRDYFENLGLHRLRGTIRYPEKSFWQQESA